jgi:putative acetyltransferase
MEAPLAPLYREMNIQDYDGLLDLWKRTPGMGLSSADRKTAIEFFLDRNPGCSYVTVETGKIVACLLAGHDGRRGYLHHLAVDPEFRQRGIGSKLVNISLDILKGMGIEKVHLFIYNDNELGKKFWSALGWELRQDIGIMSLAI